MANLRMGIYYRCTKRYLVLLEVIIAFALVALCVLPMIYPLVYILKSEREFIETIELDHIVNLLYGDTLQKLYLNQIGWSDIEEHKRFEITSLLQDIGYKGSFPFEGSYEFIIEKRKPPPPEDRIYLVKLIYTFTPKKTGKKPPADTDLEMQKPKTYIYEYKIFIERRPKHTKGGEVNEEKVNEEKVQGGGQVKEPTVKGGKP